VMRTEAPSRPSWRRRFASAEASSGSQSASQALNELGVLLA
jgi:hypothetical protein